jgi:hypothetical protein
LEVGVAADLDGEAAVTGLDAALGADALVVAVDFGFAVAASGAGAALLWCY